MHVSLDETHPKDADVPSFMYVVAFQHASSYAIVTNCFRGISLVMQAESCWEWPSVAPRTFIVQGMNTW